MSYPSVIGEFQTIAAILTGKSIARFGDGELKLTDGKGYSHQEPSDQLAAELLQILQHPHQNCLVGIPTMSPEGPKYENWLRHEGRFLRLLNPDVQYYSAFITRPDSAPRINCIEYAKTVERIWRGKKLVIVSEKKNSIISAARPAAREWIHIKCPRREAYEQIDTLEAEILATKPDIVLLSCGPTATCLAHRLAVKGIHAIDIGSAGGFLFRLLNVKKS